MLLSVLQIHHSLFTNTQQICQILVKSLKTLFKVKAVRDSICSSKNIPDLALPILSVKTYKMMFSFGLPSYDKMPIYQGRGIQTHCEEAAQINLSTGFL